MNDTITYICAVTYVQRSEYIFHHIAHFSVAVNTSDSLNVESLGGVICQEND